MKVQVTQRRARVRRGALSTYSSFG
jgi:hypothetical protein